MHAPVFVYIDTYEGGQRNMVSPSTVWDLGLTQFVRLSS